MLQNPQLMQSILENDPTYKAMLQEHPEIKGMLSDPTMLSMLNDPQILNSALNMATRAQGSSLGALSGDRSNFPMPGGDNNSSSTQQRASNPIGSNLNANGNGNNPFAFNQNPMNSVPMNNMRFPPFGFNPFFYNMMQQPNTNNPVPNSNAQPPNPFFNLAPSQAAINFEEKFKEQLSKLEEMGFTDRSKSIEALKATGGNVEAAIERMMNNTN